jgi:Asp-tRNA(Asn)/Glu-tRNA(Gln) amidotransferase A subunit family amidase
MGRLERHAHDRIDSRLRSAVESAYERLEAVQRPEVWISVRPMADVLAEADALAAAVRGGERRPLAGLIFAVKDNIDVAGLPTTAASASYAYEPTSDATSVARVRAGGALVIGKTNLDQFATGWWAPARRSARCRTPGIPSGSPVGRRPARGWPWPWASSTSPSAPTPPAPDASPPP